MMFILFLFVLLNIQIKKNMTNNEIQVYVSAHTITNTQNASIMKRFITWTVSFSTFYCYGYVQFTRKWKIASFDEFVLSTQQRTQFSFVPWAQFFYFTQQLQNKLIRQMNRQKTSVSPIKFPYNSFPTEQFETFLCCGCFSLLQ